MSAPSSSADCGQGDVAIQGADPKCCEPSDAPSCVRCPRRWRGASPGCHTCPLTRTPAGLGLHGAMMAMRSDGKHPLARGSCRGHLVSPSVPQPTSPPAAPHPSPWQREFFTFLGICCPSGLRCWQLRVPRRLGQKDVHPPATSTTPPTRRAGRAGTGPAAPQSAQGDSGPTLGGCWSTGWIWGRHGASESWQASHLPSWSSSRITCQRSPAWGMFFCLGDVLLPDAAAVL